MSHGNTASRNSSRSYDLSTVTGRPLTNQAISPESEQLPPLTLLVAANDSISLEAKVRTSRDIGLSVLSGDSIVVVREYLRTVHIDILLVSIPEDGGYAWDLVREVLSLRPEIDVLLVVEATQEDIALKYVKQGVSYITRPYTEERLKNLIENSKIHRLHVVRTSRNAILRDRTKKIDPILGSSRHTADLRKKVSLVARSRNPVLIEGELGTGKTLIAKNIAFHSNVEIKHLRVLDCRETRLLDDMLFGFSTVKDDGRAAEEIGLLACSQTILLEHIDEMTLAIQDKLHQALRSRSVSMNGSTKGSSPLKARVLAASSRNLRSLCTQGFFSLELLSQLNVFHIVLAPLRERVDDIPDLVNATLQHQFKFRGLKQEFSQEALSLLLSYPWPGNVEELQRTVQKACSLGHHPMLQSFHLPSLTQNAEPIPASPVRIPQALQPHRVRLTVDIKNELDANGGNQTAAAAALGVSRHTIWRHLKKFGRGS